MRLQGDTIAYGLATVSERFFSFFLLPVLTKAITPAEYAIWSQSAAIVSVLVPITLLGFSTSIVKFFPGNNNFQQRDSIVLMMLLIILILLAVLVLTMNSFAPVTASLLYGTAEADIFIYALAGLIVADALFDFLVSLLRAAYRIRHIAMLILTKGCLRVGVVLIAVWWTSWPFITVMYVYAATQLILVFIFLLMDMRIMVLIKTGLSYGRKMWRSIFTFSLLIVGSIAIKLSHNFADRIFIAHFTDLNELAVYSVIYTLSTMISIFYTILGFILFPYMSGRWAEGDHKAATTLAENAIHIFLFCSIPIILMLATISEYLLPLLTTDDYSASVYLFILLGLASLGFGLYQLTLYFRVLRGRIMFDILSLFLALMVNIALNALLIPPLGITGAALAAACSNGILAISAIQFAIRTTPFSFPLRHTFIIVFRAMTVVVISMLLIHLFSEMIPWQLLIIVTLVSMGIYLLLDWIDPKSLIRSRFLPT